MDWPQEMNKEMALYGVKRRFSNKDGENFVAIPKMWDELTKDKTVRKITEKGDGFLTVPATTFPRTAPSSLI